MLHACAAGEQQGGCGVAQAVKCDARQARFGQDGIERAVANTRRTNGTACGRGKHQSVAEAIRQGISCILNDHFNGISQASAFVLGLDPTKTAISGITYAEILGGFEDGAVKKAKALLAPLRLRE